MRKFRPECPHCRSTRVAPITRGPATPDTVEVVQAAVYNDAIILAGSGLVDEPSAWRCQACGHRWSAQTAAAPAA